MEENEKPKSNWGCLIIVIILVISNIIYFVKANPKMSDFGIGIAVIACIGIGYLFYKNFKDE